MNYRCYMMKINEDLYKELLILKELLEEQLENYKD